MRPLALSLALASVVLLATPAPAAPPVGESVQSFSGTILVPNPTKAAQNVTRHIRSAGLIARQSNGVVGWFFTVDPATIGGEFRLTPGDATIDYDIIFYSDPGTLNDAPTASAEFLGAAPGEVAGVIPQGTTDAIIYPTSGVNTAFSYAGYSVPTISIGVDPLDLTIPAGVTVRFINATSDYTFIKIPKIQLQAGVGPGKGIPIGATYDVTELTTPGTYPYETSVGFGTITVQ